MLPEVPLTRALDTPRTHRVAGVTVRPCRAPHHTISHVGLIGGGRVPAPGEGSRAHSPSLGRDELPEWVYLIHPHAPPVPANLGLPRA
jgi:magnesium chelatase family protein